MSNIISSKGLIEQHLHGACGVDFATAQADEIIELSKKLLELGITGFFPTLVTDTLENIRKQIAEIKSAQRIQASKNLKTAKIFGIHLEGPFLNLEKKGIHDESLILKPSIKDFKKIEDEAISIVTLAPELDNDFELCDYIQSKGIKVSAGHCLATDLTKVHQVTHLFNAMGVISHKYPATATMALINDRIHTEIIADSIHIDDSVLKLVFKTKPNDKILLISDALPIAHHSSNSMTFCNKTIYLKDKKATSEDGTLAGSAMLLPDIIKNIVEKRLATPENTIKMASTNQLNYHHIDTDFKVFFDEKMNLLEVKNEK